MRELERQNEPLTMDFKRTTRKKLKKALKFFHYDLDSGNVYCLTKGVAVLKRRKVYFISYKTRSVIKHRIKDLCLVNTEHHATLYDKDTIQVFTLWERTSREP